MDLDQIFADIRRREGDRYTNHPADRGGPTRFGVTLATLRRVRPNATAADVEALTWEAARGVYERLYIDEPGWSRIAHGQLADLCIDAGVNHGVGFPARWLQEAANELGAGLRVDGVAGPQTVAAVNRLIREGYAFRLFKEVLIRRFKLYGRIITRDPSQAVFAAGWINRACEYLDESGAGDPTPQAGF